MTQPFWEGVESPVHPQSRDDERRINGTIGRGEMWVTAGTGRRADLRQTERGLALIDALNPGLRHERTSLMALVSSPECRPCSRLPATLAELGLGHWQRQYDAGRHYLTTAAAVVARHVASAGQVADLRRQIEDIQTTGQVPWIDVSRLGDFIVYRAPHGYIPVEVPGPRK